MEKRKLNILIVDDDKFMLMAVTTLIKNLNHNLFTAADGKAALEIVMAQKLDLVLSDIQMPNGTGIFLLEEIRKIHPEIPVVHLMTGQSVYPPEEMIKKGAAGVLLKPFKRQALIDIIEAIESR